MGQKAFGGKLLQAYIITGANDAARETLAKKLAAAHICEGENRPCMECAHCRKAFRNTHPDIITADKEKDKQEFSVDVVRKIRADAYVMPNEAGGKAYIIKNADLMNTAAQNAFLKTLEEPPGNAMFILLSENPERLLDTVRSRCAVIKAEMAEDNGPNKEALSFIEDILPGGGRMITAVSAIGELKKEELRAFFTEVKKAAVYMMKKGGGAKELLKIINIMDKAEEYLAANLNSVYIMGYITAEMCTKER